MGISPSMASEEQQKCESPPRKQIETLAGAKAGFPILPTAILNRAKGVSTCCADALSARRAARPMIAPNSPRRVYHPGPDKATETVNDYPR